MSLPSPELPAPLSAAIEARLEGRAQGMLRDRARQLSERYRPAKPTIETIRDETDALAYAATRMPATYAAIVTALGRLDEEQPRICAKAGARRWLRSWRGLLRRGDRVAQHRRDCAH